MRISDWSSDVCSSDLGERWQCSGKGARQRASGRTRLFRRAEGDRIMTGNLTDLTVAAIRDGFRKGEFTAREVADAFNANVAAAKALNAFIVETPDHALAAADAADKARAGDKRLPLSGVRWEESRG